MSNPNPPTNISDSILNQKPTICEDRTKCPHNDSKIGPTTTHTSLFFIHTQNLSVSLCRESLISSSSSSSSSPPPHAPGFGPWPRRCWRFHGNPGLCLGPWPLWPQWEATRAPHCVGWVVNVHLLNTVHTTPQHTVTAKVKVLHSRFYLRKSTQVLMYRYGRICWYLSTKEEETTILSEITWNWQK